MPFDFRALRRRFKQGHEHGAWIVNNGYTRTMALAEVENGNADMVSFGRPFMSNPDLVNRLRLNEVLTPLDTATLYGGGAAGYTDYTVFTDEEANATSQGIHRTAARTP